MNCVLAPCRHSNTFYQLVHVHLPFLLLGLIHILGLILSLVLDWIHIPLSPECLKHVG